MGKKLFQDPFSTPPQPEEAILKLLEADNDNPFTLGTPREFVSRLTFFMTFVIGFVYLFRNELPTVSTALLIVVSFLLISTGLYLLFNWFNELMVSRGLKAMYLLMFILLVIAIL